MQNEQLQAPGPEQPTPGVTADSTTVVSTAPLRTKWRIIALVVVIAVLLLVITGGAWYLLARDTGTKQSATAASDQSTPSGSTTATSETQGLQLDIKKNYGNKYADGILPVGDGKYVTSGPRQGYVYTCSQYAQNLASDNGGAQTRGPWFTNSNASYDLSKKVRVAGQVTWQGAFSNLVSGTTRTIATNDLPSHYTGTFPIGSTDPAYRYDRNPNTIKGQNYTFSLAARPTYGVTPNCIGGIVGVMLTGTEIFSAFDAGGRDAGAWEVQDGCSGHPEKTGAYHYHTLSSCIKDIGAQTVIGYALDGFPITGPEISHDNILTTSDLDECHGITSQIVVDGKAVTSYHYVMTQDFPYSVSCYRAPAIQPPGLTAPSGQQHP